MLARTPYKTAEELKITPDEFDGLVAFVEDARDGKLETAIGPHKFDMLLYVHLMSNPSCGTMGCIKGYMAIRNGSYWGDPDWFWNSDALQPLFIPSNNKAFFCTDISAAAFCVERFLQTGEVNWELALKIGGE